MEPFEYLIAETKISRAQAYAAEVRQRKGWIVTSTSRSAAEAAIRISKGDRNVPWEKAVLGDAIKQWNELGSARPGVPEEQRKRAP